ncbi:MAG TPA: hypothetical protein DCQ31_02265 [Bacteroidales bacterium]|nr:hypothetical protein [Bacteroidales bacterium]
MKKIISLLVPVLLITFFACNKATNIVDAETIINDIKNRKPIILKNKTINGVLNFSKAGMFFPENSAHVNTIIYSPIAFYNCTFTDSVYTVAEIANNVSSSVLFMQSVTFEACNFKNEIEFKNAEFSGIVNFNQSVFEKKASFIENTFTGRYAFFSGTTFKENARFIGLKSTNNLVFMHAMFMSTVDFQQIKSGGILQFSAMNLLRKADFTNLSGDEILFSQSIFDQEAAFIGILAQERLGLDNIYFKKGVSFENITAQGAVNFESTKSDGRFSIKNALFYFEKPVLKPEVSSDTMVHISGIRVLKALGEKAQ